MRRRSHRTDGLRILVTVTFNTNQLRSHLLPLLAIDGVAEVVLVADAAPAPMLGVRVVIPPQFLSRLFGRAVAKLLVCGFLAIRDRPDWIMGYNLVPHGLNAYIAGRASGAKVMYHQIGGPKEWDGGGWMSDNKLLGRLPRPSRAVERGLLAIVRRADIVATMGTSGREALLRRGLDPERVVVVPPALDPSRTAEPRAAGTRYDVVAIGNLIPRKRHSDLLKAVASLRARGLSLRLGIAGDGPLAEDLADEAARIAVGDLVSFLGFREDVKAVYESAGVFALPSRDEGLSIALLDAMASGLAPIATSVGDIRDVVHDGESGILFAVGDVEGLADGLARLVGDDDFRERIAAAARLQALSWAGVGSVAERLRATMFVPSDITIGRPFQVSGDVGRPGGAA